MNSKHVSRLTSRVLRTLPRDPPDWVEVGPCTWYCDAGSAELGLLVHISPGEHLAPLCWQVAAHPCHAGGQIPAPCTDIEYPGSDALLFASLHAQLVRLQQLAQRLSEGQLRHLDAGVTVRHPAELLEEPHAPAAPPGAVGE